MTSKLLHLNEILKLFLISTGPKTRIHCRLQGAGDCSCPSEGACYIPSFAKQMMLSVLLIASTAHDAADPAHVADAANPAAATYVAHNAGASHGCAAGTEATVDANDDDGTMMPRISLTKTKPTSKPVQPC